jgi:hypothetical protein
VTNPKLSHNLEHTRKETRLNQFIQKKLFETLNFSKTYSTIDDWKTYERDETGLSYIYDNGCTIRPNSPQTKIDAANATDCASKCKTDTTTNRPCTHFHYRPAGRSCIMRYGETSISDVVRDKFDNDMICGIIIGKNFFFLRFLFWTLFKKTPFC